MTVRYQIKNLSLSGSRASQPSRHLHEAASLGPGRAGVAESRAAPVDLGGAKLVPPRSQTASPFHSRLLSSPPNPAAEAGRDSGQPFALALPPGYRVSIAQDLVAPHHLRPRGDKRTEPQTREKVVLLQRSREEGLGSVLLSIEPVEPIPGR